MALQCVGMIPARFGASRFPGKLLADLGGRPVIRWVVEQALRSSRLSRVLVVTDDERIAEAVRGAGVEVFRSRLEHTTGTDRLGEAATALGILDRPIVNIQGDEPFLGADAIDACVRALEEDAEVAMATLATPCSPAEANEPSVVKVVVGRNARAIYFSRAPIPWSGPDCPARLRHVGIYAFREGALERFLALPAGVLEQAERLEQLRAVESGWPIGVLVGAFDTIGIDTPADLDEARRRVAGRAGVNEG